MEKPSFVENQPQPQSQQQPSSLSTSLSIKRKPVANNNSSRPSTGTGTATAVPQPPPPAPPAPPAVTTVRTVQDPEKRAYETVTTTTGTYRIKKSSTADSSSTSSSSSSTTSIPNTEKELATYTANYTHTHTHGHGYGDEKRPKYDAPLPPIPSNTTSKNNDTTFSSSRRDLRARTRRIRTIITSLPTHFQSLRKRTRYLILTGLFLILILIIGLAAGLSASSHNKFKNLPLPNSNGGPVTGDLTYYDPGLGACGWTSKSSDFIVAVSHRLFDAVQAGGSNVNANPLCGKKIRARRGEVSVDLTVVDRCTGCKPQDIDVTRTVFGGLADIDEGRVRVSWAWLEDVPSDATGS